MIRWLPATLAVGFALTVYLETRLWLLAKFPYFLDEGILALYAQIGHDPTHRLSSLDVGIRPGLVWLTMGGMKLHLDPMVSIRLVAVLFGLIALVSGTIMALRYVGQTAAVAFAVLALFTPFLFLYNSLGLRDPVIAGLMVAGLLLEIELAQKPRFAIAVLLGLTFAFDLWVKDSGKVALYLLPLSLVYFPFRSPRRIRLGAAWIGNVALALAMAFAATLPMRLGSAYGHLGTTEQAFAVMRSFAAVRAHPLLYFNDSWPAVRGELTSYLTYPTIVLVMVGLGLGLRRRPRFTSLVAVWAIAQVASVIWIATNAYARYLTPAIPFILLLAAIGVDELVRVAGAIFGTGRRVGVGCVLAGVLLLVPALVFDAQASYDPASASYPPSDRFQYITGFTSGFGIPEAADELKVFAGGKRIVVLTDPHTINVPLQVLSTVRGVLVEFVTTSSSDAKFATALVTNGSPVPPGIGPYHRIWSYQRPDHGTPLAIYARG